MVDQHFIQGAIDRSKDAKAKAKSIYHGITANQLNWKADPAIWSMGECLEHLIISNRLYFSTLDEIVAGSYQMSFWAQYNPLSSVLGKSLILQSGERVTRKMKSPKSIRPTASKKSLEIVNEHLMTLNTLQKYISACKEIDLDKVIITSPIMSVVTYSLRDAIQFLVEHEHRHLNQASNVFDI